MFQSTHLHEVWLSCDGSVLCKVAFQSTHLHEVWRPNVSQTSPFRCFNPHTYMRCDFLFGFGVCVQAVSIHTPTWGVTWKKFILKYLETVSIHTPTWGVTLSNSGIGRSSTVSIHTPTWGVTHYNFQETHNNHVSIHTPTWGVTPSILWSRLRKLFQSTHLHEVWRRGGAIQPTARCFNPHTYMRCDTTVSNKNPRSEMFQSTHLHEVWLTIAAIAYSKNACFNPHTYMRCDKWEPRQS